MPSALRLRDGHTCSPEFGHEIPQRFASSRFIVPQQSDLTVVTEHTGLPKLDDLWLLARGTAEASETHVIEVAVPSTAQALWAAVTDSGDAVHLAKSSKPLSSKWIISCGECVGPGSLHGVTAEDCSLKNWHTGQCLEETHEGKVVVADCKTAQNHKGVTVPIESQRFNFLDWTYIPASTPSSGASPATGAPGRSAAGLPAGAGKNNVHLASTGESSDSSSNNGDGKSQQLLINGYITMGLLAAVLLSVLALVVLVTVRGRGKAGSSTRQKYVDVAHQPLTMNMAGKASSENVRYSD